MKRYVTGRYFSSDDEMEFLKNPPNRLIVDKLTEVYPARRTAKQLESDFSEKSNIVKSTIHDRLIELRKNFFIYELNKQQTQELKDRRIFGALIDLGEKQESSISAKYVVEDVSNSLYPVLPYHLAPGYCHYTEEFQAAWNHLTPMIERELVENLRTNILRLIIDVIDIAGSSGINEISKVVPTGMLPGNERIRVMTGLENFRCANCGIDHESRNFIRAIVLHLLDDFEVSDDFIAFLKSKKIINERGYELYQHANTQSNLFTGHKTRQQIESQNKTDVERLRIISINRYSEKTFFLCIDKDAKVLAGVANSSLISDNLAPNSIIEFNKSDSHVGSDVMFGDIEISKADSYIRIIDEDTLFPRYSDLPVTKIRDITSDRNYYVLIVKVVKSPVRRESVDPETMEQVPGMDYAVAIVEDDTGQIQLAAINPFILDGLKSGDRIKVIGKSLFHPVLNRYYVMLPTNINSFEKL